MIEDAQLLRRYVAERSQEAFAELVRRHVDLVYFAALRRVGGDAHLADDVAQSVFADLARKAASLQDRPALAGWLYTSTRFAAAQAVRSEQRRRVHEQEAHTMNELHGASEPDWNRLRPVIDDAMDELDEHEREAVLLRFFERRSFAEVGARFSLSADAARMRVERALDKLRGLLARRGIASTSVALATAFAAQTGFSAPANLVAKIVAGTVAQTGTATASVFAAGKILAGAAVGVLAAGLLIYQINAARKSPPAPVSVVTTMSATGTRAPLPAVESAAFEDVETVVTPRENAPIAVTPQASNTAFGALSDRQKRILKTLWERRKTFPATPIASWSFKPGNTAPAAMVEEFIDAAARLKTEGLVGLNAKPGTVFLTEAGDAFCRLHAAEIDAYRLLPVPSVPIQFAVLPMTARDILKTLWEHQKISPDQPPRRWGFKLSPDSPNFAAFETAAAGLREVNGLVGVSAQTGIVFLTDRGRVFCEAHAAEIDAHPLPARNFRPMSSEPANPSSVP